jgi:tRNA pseudouridine55 synthase
MPDCANCPKARPEPRQRWVAPKRDVPLSGILNIDKPPGMTSHDVVGAVRRIAGQRKVGHAGTLDPMATGVLLVCLGQATRVTEYLMEGHKRYRATIVLGTTTDTYDAEGEVLSDGGRTDWREHEIRAALDRFVGSGWQVPPMYSAIKREGKPLYKLARQGKVVQRKPRPVEISEIVLLDWTPPSLIVEIACSPGTYVRSLAHDMGQQLGSGAYLGCLVRLRSGRFSLEEAVSLERVEEAFEHGEESRYLLPIDEALLDQPAIVVGSGDAQRLVQGQSISGEVPANGERERESLRRVYSFDGDFLAIAAYDPATGLWKPHKVFAQVDPRTDDGS